jgi:LuxR family transcriptional regulator, maltose regulon positive regulatory protein
LVTRLTGDVADGFLADLARAGAFAEDAPAAPGGYQIHPLLRELLAARLRFERPYTVTALPWICAAWFASTGRLSEAVAHAASAGGLLGPGGSVAGRPRRVPDLAPAGLS